jgi:hypothetical protein
MMLASSPISLGCLQRREGLPQLVLLASKLVLTSSEMVHAATQNGKIKRHRFELSLQFRRSYSGAGRGGGQQPRWSPSPDHLTTVVLPCKRDADTDENRNEKTCERARYPLVNR